MKALEFKGSGYEYFKIWIVNIALVVLTLSIYYPWAKVRNRRYLYANSFFEDRNFEYHATGKQLFIGYLITLAIFILFVVSQTLAPQVAGFFFLLLAIAIPLLVWRSFRFNLQMSSFSNVRFGFNGTLGGAYWNFLILPLLVIGGIVGVIVSVVSVLGAGMSIDTDAQSAASGGGPLFLIIGLFFLVSYIVGFAFIAKNVNTYRINGTRFGQTLFSTELATRRFVGISLKVMGASAILLILLFAIIAALSAASGIVETVLATASAENPLEAQQVLLSQPGIIGLVIMIYVGFLIIGTVIAAFQICLTRNYLYSQTKLGGNIELNSTLKLMSFAWLLLSNFLLQLFTLALATPWTKVRTMRYLLKNTHLDGDVDFSEYISQQETMESSLGEQLGDAFDVGVDVAF